MKNPRVLIYLFGILLTLPYIAQAQEDSLQQHRGTRYYGYIVKLDGDTVPGYVLNLNLWNNQMMAYYYEDMDRNNKGTKYRAKNLLGYKTGNREYERLQHSGLFSPYKYNFFLIVVDGAIDLFVWYYNTDINLLMGTDALLTEPSDSYLINEEMLWKQMIGRTEDGEIIEFGSLKFKPRFHRKMAHLVNDNHELAKKIRNQEDGYRYKDLEKIIREYNKWRTDKKSVEF